MTKMFNNKISYNKNKSIEDIIIITINITINPRMHIQQVLPGVHLSTFHEMIYHIRAPLICTLSPISLSPPLSASFYCCKKLPQMWWFKKNTHKNTSVFFHSSGVQNSKIKVSTELHSFYRIWERTLPSVARLLGGCGHSLASWTCRHTTFSLSLIALPSLCIFSFSVLCKNTCHWI